MYADNRPEELSYQSLVHHAATINDTGRAYMRQTEHARRVADDRHEFATTHDPVGRIPLTAVTEHLAFAIALVAIWMLDIVLFGAPAEYLTGTMSGGFAGQAVAKYGFPACFIVIEVFIALQIERAKHEQRFESGSILARRLWLALGVAVALVMPFCAKAVAESAGVVDNSNTSVPLIAVLAVISFAAHVLILFNGRRAQEAKAYLLFVFTRWFHKTRATSADERAKSLLSDFNREFILYVHRWRHHNGRYTPVQSGPWDAKVIELLREQFPQIAKGGALQSVDEREE
jgi:hypothetical protein